MILLPFILGPLTQNKEIKGTGNEKEDYVRCSKEAPGMLSSSVGPLGKHDDMHVLDCRGQTGQEIQKVGNPEGKLVSN